LKEGRIASIQTLSGTGSLRIGFEFLSAYYPRTVYISNPTWLNHKAIIEKSNLKWLEYPYYSSKTQKVDIKGMI
jgi:aspartate/tyrosine/aromatic aminotransferase